MYRDEAAKLLEARLRPGDRVCLDDHQRQGDSLAEALAQVGPGRVHDLRMV